MPELQNRWKLAKDIDKQSYTRLEMANGSEIIGIPGDPNKLRSSHPTCVVFDEAAFIERLDESYHIALATRAPKIIALSSVDVGPFWDYTRASKSCEWPNYSEAVVV